VPQTLEARDEYLTFANQTPAYEYSDERKLVSEYLAQTEDNKPLEHQEYVGSSLVGD